MVNSILITTYSVVCIISEVLLFIIVKFIREKPLDKQRFLDYVQIDVAACTGLYIGFHSTMSVLREIIGPFSSEVLVEALMFCVLWLFYAMSTCILSLQFVQFFCIFYSATLHEWGDSALILGHRIFVFSGSLGASGSFILESNEGCWFVCLRSRRQWHRRSFCAISWISNLHELTNRLKFEIVLWYLSHW